MSRLLGIALGLACAAVLAGPLSAAPPIAASAEAVQPLEVGERAPGVTLRDVDGREVALASLWGEKPVVLIFYRGGW